MARAAYPPSDETLTIGASWYPEMWPAAEWPRDVARMQELGFNLVRLFEFAWHRFEPAPGVYDFDWAVAVLDHCHAAGIRAMIGTPTAAPPAWLTDTWPEVLGTRADGSRKTHGQRKHYNHHSVLYREKVQGIVEALCRHLAGHPAVHSWQIDNEMSGFDYGPETRRHFQAWLARRYGAIDTLNQAWGLEFWSQAYSAFEQVPLVTAAVGSVEVPERHHPSLIMAIARFQNEAWSSFIAEQCAVIRRYSDRPITTNMTGMIGAMDWFAHNRELDRVGASMYADRRYYYYNLPRFDRMRAEKAAPYWLLETAPNWSGGGRTFNIHFDHHGPRQFAWLSTLLGGSMVLFWQWREHWAGQEMLHGTHVTATGQWRPGKAVWERLATEFRDHGPWLVAHPPLQPELALVVTSEAAWAFSIDPTDSDMAYPHNVRDRFHLPLAQRHWWRDVIDTSADFAPYRVIAMPMLPQVDETVRCRLHDWVVAGGTLVLGPLTGFRSAEFTAFTDQVFGGFEAMMGATSALRFTCQWVEDQVTVPLPSGRRAAVRTWGEAFEAQGATVLARWEGGYGDGLPAVVDHRFGAGRVISIGAVMDGESYAELVGLACRDAGIEPLADAPPQAVIAPRATATGALAGYGICNNSAEPITVRLPHGGEDVLGGRSCPDGRIDLEPWDVALVQVDT